MRRSPLAPWSCRWKYDRCRGRCLRFCSQYNKIVVFHSFSFGWSFLMHPWLLWSNEKTILAFFFTMSYRGLAVWRQYLPPVTNTNRVVNDVCYTAIFVHCCYIFSSSLNKTSNCFYGIWKQLRPCCWEMKKECSVGPPGDKRRHLFETCGSSSDALPEIKSSMFGGYLRTWSKDPCLEGICKQPTASPREGLYRLIKNCYTPCVFLLLLFAAIPSERFLPVETYSELVWTAL